MVDDVWLRLSLYLMVGVLAAIVYSLRVLVLLDRKMERIEEHIERMAESIVSSKKKTKRR